MVTLKKNFARALLVLLTVAIAIGKSRTRKHQQSYKSLKYLFNHSGVPRFGLIISLIGAFGSSALAFILPSAFHLKLMWHEIPIFSRCVDVTIFVFGVSASIVGTVTAMIEIVNSLT